MCAGTILQSRIKRLVFGTFNEKAGAVGSVIDLIRDQRVSSRVEVVTGVLNSECAQILRKYFKIKLV